MTFRSTGISVNIDSTLYVPLQPTYRATCKVTGFEWGPEQQKALLLAFGGRIMIRSIVFIWRLRMV